MFNKTKRDENGLPDFKIGVSATHDFLTLTFLDNTSQFPITDCMVDGWSVDDFMTKCIGRLSCTIELRNKLSGK